jgi:hypothetical protein
MQKATLNIGIPHEIREKRPSAVHPPNLAVLLPHAPKELNTDEAKHGNNSNSKNPKARGNQPTKPTSARLDSKIETKDPKANPPPTSKMPTQKGEPTGEHKRSFPNAKRKITTSLL